MPIGQSQPPPAKTTTRVKATPQQPVSKTKERSDGLEGYAQLAQAGLIAFRQYADAGALGLHFPKIAEEIAKLASADDRVAGWIDPIIAAGPYTALIAAVLPLAMQLGVNHGRMKPGAMGTVPKNLLSARIETGIAQMEAEAYAAQMEAEAEAERLREQMRQAKAVIPGRAA
jgi:hypothetical protein